MKIAINAQKPLGSCGGIVNFTLGLLHGLGKLDDSDDEYIIIASPENIEQIGQSLAPNQRAVLPWAEGPRPLTIAQRAVRKYRHLCNRFNVNPHWWRSSKPVSSLPPPRHWPSVPISNGFYESLGVDVIHFPYQEYALTSLPSIFQPWDFQHRYFPQFFDPQALAHREHLYPAACRMAHAVVVATESVKRDAILQTGIDANKIEVIPVAAPLQAELDANTGSRALSTQDLAQKYQIPNRFVYYPAVTWPHKNHARLLEAIAHLRDHHGMRVNLVCTGALNDHYHSVLRPLVAKLHLENQVHFLGLIETADVKAIYQQSEFVVFPSLFEGAGMPPLEAWSQQKAVACSNATTLPEIVGDAGLLFDPENIHSIAEALREFTSNPSKRRRYEMLGMERSKAFNWDITARHFRALYRQLAGCKLTDDDLDILSPEMRRRVLAKEFPDLAVPYGAAAG